MTCWWIAVAALAAAAPVVERQSSTPAIAVSGTVGAGLDAVPRRDAIELRPAVDVLLQWTPNARWRATADVEVTGLAADRSGARGAATVEARDLWVEVVAARVELRAGLGRLAWGKLDEVQPTDVINPIDSSRFFLSGRADARLSTVFARARVFAGDAVRIEGVVTPVFRRSRFDRLDEKTSPFNLVRDAVLPAGVGLSTEDVAHVTPAATWRNVSLGTRVSVTTGRVDWSVAAYRGFDGFGPIELETSFVASPTPTVVGKLVGRHPRFTMVGADFETVRGDWAWRGEVAVFPEKTLTSALVPGGVPGQVIEGGAGFDRSVGSARIFGSVLVHRARADGNQAPDTLDVNIVGSIERAFGRERYRARAFAVVNPADASAFVRGLVTWSVKDNLGADFSAGAFLGSGDDAIARFTGRDFLLARIRYAF